MEESVQLRLEGYCLLKGVIPPDKVGQTRLDIDNEMKAGLEAYNQHDWSAVSHMLSLAPYFSDARPPSSRAHGVQPCQSAHLPD